MDGWVELFKLTTSVPELLIRGTVTFLALTAILRLVGQREAGDLGITDLLVVLLVADAASAGLRGKTESIAEGLILVATVLFWSVAFDALAYRWPKLGRILKARPKLLIRDGQLDRRVMRREFMNEDEVMSQLRLHGVTELSDVERAYIEPNGMVSIIRRDGEANEEVTRPPEV
ncbi:MAG TPA: YetF domain-containing protein [Myxococcaceae bacterium]|nr:YetF domain-containing protein [Myxococcaceae bacterium]